MRTKVVDRKLLVFVLVSCMAIFVGSALAKDPNRVFSGQVVNPSKHGVSGVTVHLRAQGASADQAGGESAGMPSGNTCPPPELCQVTAHNGDFSFHQIKTGIYDLFVSKDGQVIYTKPEPLLIPQMPANTHLLISLPAQSPN